ncbi:MAG: hypothetical protein IPQ09_28700 [Myxococcales bacterium]|nr:hypothetical protein [Myxococcales bacterium]HQY63696.1 hypothetical protein [Polyangiaceae bacterium]
MGRVGLATLALLGACATACGSVETHTAMLRAPGPPRPRAAVDLYLGDQTPARALDELGFVQAYGSGNKATPEDLAGALVARAAELGCDAVVHVAIDVGYTRAHAAGVCVAWVGPPPAGFAYERPVLAPSPPRPPRGPAPPGPQPRIEPLPSNSRM